MIKVGDKVYLKENPFSTGGFLPAGEKESPRLQKMITKL